MALTKCKLGAYIELRGETNASLVFGPDDVRGVNNLKLLMPTKADINGRDLSKFQIVYPGEFVFNHRTSRNGSKFSIAYNDGEKAVICTEDYVVFRIKEDAKDSIMSLKKSNIKQAVMLTGDRKAVGENVAGILGIDKVYTELLPDGKVEKVEELLKEKSEKGKLAFVGDGINDAPVLALADIGIAMGGLGADSAIEAADIVLMTDEPSKIVDTIRLSKKTMKIVKENIIFAISVKVLVLILSAIGISTMWEAVFADVGVSIIAILNALRVLNVKKMK